MATRLDSVVFDVGDPVRAGRWWARTLLWRIAKESADEVTVEPLEDDADEHGVPLVFGAVPEAKAGKNRLHLDLASASPGSQALLVDRLTGTGARTADIGQGDGVPWTVLADPAGNELCVLEPRERYTGTGPVAAIVTDAADPPALARFWSEAAGWPVTDSDDEVAALRHPSGRGPFLEFVRVYEPKRRKNRLHLDVAPRAGDDQAAEVERLLALGATRADVGQGDDVSWVVLADPEGNEFCVLSPR